MDKIIVDESFHAQHPSKQQQLQPQQESPTLLPSSPISSTNASSSANTITQTTNNNDTKNGNPSDSHHHYRLVEEELQNVRESETRFKQLCTDAQKREKMLIRRLAAKEQEMQEYVNQNAELKASQAPTMAALRSVLLDPAVNILFQKLKVELQATKARLEDTQNELSAWKFTPDSNTGKRLMAKCRLLYQENEELGKMTSNGRLAKLEGDLALQKSFSEEVKKSQSELDDFLQELDEDVEGMQSTILYLQQELKLAKETINILERENAALKNGNGTCGNGPCVCGNTDIDNKPTEANAAEVNESYEGFVNGSRNPAAAEGDSTTANAVEVETTIASNEPAQLHSHFTLHSMSNTSSGITAKPQCDEQQRSLRSTRTINSVVEELRTSKAVLMNINNGEQNGNYVRKGVKRGYEQSGVTDEEDDDDDEEDDVLSTSSDNEDNIIDRSKRRRKRRKN